MDAKNWEAVGQGGAWMLSKFTNLPIEKAAVGEFCQTYGELMPGLPLRKFQVYVKVFQSAWQAKTWEDRAAIGEHITAIFERDTALLRRLPPFKRFPPTSWGGLPPIETLDDPERRPAVVADFTTGTMTVKPRTLLDWLAKWLLEYRNKLAICERKGCEHPYFVKTHPRYRYCSPDCAYKVRTGGKREWWKENRGKNGKRRKQARAGRARRSGQTRP